MAGPKCQAGQGKDGAAQTLGQAWLLKKGEVTEISAWREPLVGVELVLGGGACLRAWEFV
jgi:hypothetical protein